MVWPRLPGYSAFFTLGSLVLICNTLRMQWRPVEVVTSPRINRCNTTIIMRCCKPPCAGIADRIRGLSMAEKLARSNGACLHFDLEYFLQPQQDHPLCGTDKEFVIRGWDSDARQKQMSASLSEACSKKRLQQVLLYTNNIWLELCDLEGIGKKWCAYRAGLSVLHRHPVVYGPLSRHISFSRALLGSFGVRRFIGLHVRVGGSFLDNSNLRRGTPWTDGHVSNTSLSLLQSLEAASAKVSMCQVPLFVFSDSARFVAEVEFLLHGKARVYHCCGNKGHAEHIRERRIADAISNQVFFEFTMMSLSERLYSTAGGYGIVGRHFLDYNTSRPLVKCMSPSCMGTSFIPDLMKQMQCSVS